MGATPTALALDYRQVLNTMPQFAYLLIQQTTHDTYEIRRIQLTDHLTDTANVGVLLDHAFAAVTQRLDSPWQVEIMAYKLLNPIPGWDCKSHQDIKDVLGKIDKQFFLNKVYRLSPSVPLSELQADFRLLQVLVFFSLSEKRLQLNDVDFVKTWMIN